MTEQRIQELENALRATKGDVDFALAWLEAQPDVAILNCTADEHPDLTGESSPYNLVFFVGEPKPGPMVVMPHAPADRVDEWHSRLEAAL